MAILIGMDEAGYGPNLGPLVVAATAWEVAGEGLEFGANGSGNGELSGRRTSEYLSRDRHFNPQSRVPTGCRNPKSENGSCEIDLYRLLRSVVAKRASERRIAIADSKALYHPGQGLRHLERGLHAVLLAMRQSLGCWLDIVNYCEADADGHHARVCWPDGFDCPLPIDAPAEELARLAARFERACDSAGVRPLAIRAKLVFPAQFNELVAYYGTKGGALSHVTVGLLREVVDLLRPPAIRLSSSKSVADGVKGTGTDQNDIPHEPTPKAVGASPLYVVCDKHGGRNYYTALLQHHFSEHWIQPVLESREESRYEWGPPKSRMRVKFRVNGESFMPTALASMTAKYLRELAMRAFNVYWCAHVPGLRPTAGYYRDAGRFKKDIAAKQRELGIDDHVLWRNR